MHEIWTLDFQQMFQENFGEKLEVDSITRVSGGCIHEAYAFDSDKRRYFMKRSTHRDMFVAEADGLKGLRETSFMPTKHFVIPEVLGFIDLSDGSCCLLLEFLDLETRGREEAMGEALAELHSQRREPFGWRRDNYIGETPQLNPVSEDWVTFLMEYRLGAMLKSLHQQNRLVDVELKILEHIPRFFEDYRPVPSMLHGDLWIGNAAYLKSGAPVCFDPAVYIGDREFDLAMTELFGGFGAGFYKAYHRHFPIDAGYENRRSLYQLYHIMNHALLFGGGYEDQARRGLLALEA